MDRIQTFFKTKPVFLFLLPLFFVFHAYTEYFVLLSPVKALLLTGTYLACAFFLAILSWLLYRDFHKANLLAFVLMAYDFFFGSIHDFMKQNLGHGLITKYIFIIPASFVLFIILIIYLKKSKRRFIRIGTYLNWLLLALILIDIVHFIFKAIKTNDTRELNLSTQFIPCDSCAKPDVYLFILDEYAGKQELNDVFSYDNSRFEIELKQRKFHVVNQTTSNYNATIYSMASLLNMDYLKHVGSSVVNNQDMFHCTDVLRDNNTVAFFRKQGYRIFNYSVFDLNEEPAAVRITFFPSREALITSQTFTNRAYHDLAFNFASAKDVEEIRKNSLHNNIKVDSLTINTSLDRNRSPKFVYTHLTMPHYPYYFDSNSKARPVTELGEGNNTDKKAYLQYLVYANKKILQLIDKVVKNSGNPPIILLMSDHGFRQFADSTDKKNYFINLNAVYLPNGNYAGFYDGMSNVNQFRILLNSQFGQQLPILKDSTTFLWSN